MAASVHPPFGRGRCEVRLTQAGAGPWRVPEEPNLFGVFVCRPDVKAIAARGDDLIIRPGGTLATLNGASTWSAGAVLAVSWFAPASQDLWDSHPVRPTRPRSGSRAPV